MILFSGSNVVINVTNIDVKYATYAIIGVVAVGK